MFPPSLHNPHPPSPIPPSSSNSLFPKNKARKILQVQCGTVPPTSSETTGNSKGWQFKCPVQISLNNCNAFTTNFIAINIHSNLIEFFNLSPIFLLNLLEFFSSILLFMRINTWSCHKNKIKCLFLFTEFHCLF